MGLSILVTEHDVDDSGGPTDIAVRDRAVADASARFLDVVLDNEATLAVLTWGLTDRYLKTDNGLRATLSGYSPRKLPLDINLKRKPMWSAMAKAFGA
jgi:endo-1,4-beta-xylanase